MKIAFITDGGLEMGMGHIYRTITLAEELKANAEIFFLTKSDKIVVSKIGDSGFDVLKLKNDEEIINHLEEINLDIIIIDRLNIEESFIKKIRDKLNTKIVIFDNLSSANKYADIVVNAIVGSDFKNRKFLDKSTNTLYFYGPKYLVLRKKFYEFKKKRHKKLGGDVKRILLTFGGSDASNLTSKVLDELLRLKYKLEIDVLLGPHFVYFGELKQVLEKYQDKKEKVRIYKDIKNVAELMYKADLVITSPGLTMLESLCIGTPTIAIYQNLLQKKVWGYFKFAFDISEIKDFEELIFSTHESFRKEWNDIKQLDIGGGKAEIIKAITKIGKLKEDGNMSPFIEGQELNQSEKLES